MKNKKMHKLDLVFILGNIVIAIVAMILDWLSWKDIEYGGFPVFSCLSIYVVYALWIIILIYSSIHYKEKENKPEFARWYMIFLLPYLYIGVVIILLIILLIINSLF